MWALLCGESMWGVGMRGAGKEEGSAGTGEARRMVCTLLF